jgi:hypothetical protein
MSLLVLELVFQVLVWSNVWLQMKMMWCSVHIRWKVKGRSKGATMVVTFYFFKGTMFELQPYHYYKNISKCFCMLWLVKTEKNLMPKKVHFFVSYDVMLEYNCTKKMYIAIYWKWKYIQEWLKWLKWFLIFMKFIVFTKHCDSIWLK